MDHESRVRASAKLKAVGASALALGLAVAMAGCERPALSGYGFLGRIRPDPEVASSVSRSDITDPSAALNVLKAIEENAPAQTTQGDRIRERAVWDARLAKIPEASTYLLTIQCGTRQNSPSYFSYDLNSGTASVRLYDGNLYDSVKEKVEARERDVLHAELSWALAVLRGALPELPMGDDQEWLQIEGPLRDKGANIQLPDGVIFRPQDGISNLLIESDLRRAQYDEAFSEWQLHNTSRLMDSLPSSKKLLDDENAWNAGPLPGLLTADAPVKGGGHNACLIARVANLDVATATIDGRSQDILYGNVAQWYFVDRKSERVLSQTAPSAVASIVADRRP